MHISLYKISNLDLELMIQNYKYEGGFNFDEHQMYQSFLVVVIYSGRSKEIEVTDT